MAEDLSLTNLLAAGELHDQRGETQASLKAYQAADHLSPNDPEILFQLAKQYCDSMRSAASRAEVKKLAEQALDCGLRALKAEPQDPRKHVCVAVCYAKNFPYVDNQTRVNYSRQIKSEAEKAIVLDPKYDLAYHMLGRWHFEVSNMNIFVKGLVKLAYGGMPMASKELAIQNFQQAIKLAPNRIIHHLQLARMYHATGRENLVGDELKKCLPLTPVDLEDRDAQQIAKKVLQGEKWPETF